MKAMKANNDGWIPMSNQVFWGEIAPCEHVVQIYENDEVFLDLLCGFVSAGVNSGDSVIVIATASHLENLHDRLQGLGHEVGSLMATSQYIPLDAQQMLSRFMVNGWPDETLFNYVVADVIGKAKQNERQVRAFGEMVALLWAKGQVGATVRLEHLWNKFCENEAFSLFCAYPRTGFTQDASESVMHICGAHSKMIAGVQGGGMTDLVYKDIDQQEAL
jgi:hypothetical protein